MPYILPRPEFRGAWSQRFEAVGDKPRVGVVWAGNPHHRNDANRSIPAAALAPLATITDSATLFDLQTGVMAGSGNSYHMTRLADEFKDFADTAGAMMNLDLVISVDTAAAHLAGALALPVWTLLPYAADWRWLENADSTPWYPTMRLFRQKSPGDWAGVMERVCNSLRTYK